jgi:hypothetical protein
VKPIKSVNDFAHRVGYPVTRLWALAQEIDQDKKRHYNRWSEPYKSDPKRFRHFWVPKPELKELQGRIRRVLESIPLSSAAHGSVKGCSPRTNASKHLGKRWVINLDVKSFFPSVRHYVVQDMLKREYGFGRDVAWLITRLVTVDSQLPQGTPTSPIVANLLLSRGVDVPVTASAQAIQADSTRFLDDVTFSGDEPHSLINLAARALSRKRLSIWRRKGTTPKFKMTPRSARQQVTGLVVNATSGPSVPLDYRGGVRAAIYQLQSLTGHERTRELNSITGRIAYVRQTNPGAAARLQGYLDRQMT